MTARSSDILLFAPDFGGEQGPLPGLRDREAAPGWTQAARLPHGTRGAGCAVGVHAARACVSALLEGRSTLVTAPDSAAGFLSDVAAGLATAGMRVLLVHPPLDLPAFMAQLARHGTPDAASTDAAAGTGGSLLERGFDALTLPAGTGGGIALLIEGAHGLPGETLRYIQFAIQTEPRLALVFAGGPELDAVLAAPSYAVLRGRLSAHRVVLPPSLSVGEGARRRGTGMVPAAAAALVAVAVAGAASWVLLRHPAALPSLPFTPAIRLGTLPGAASLVPDIELRPQPMPPIPAPPMEQAPPPQAPPVPEPPPAPEAPLPDAAIPRIILRYRDGPTDKARAAELLGTLRGGGLQVEEPVAAPVAATAVSFFYEQDQPEAERVARMVFGSAATQRRLFPRQVLPPPGTIEVSVAGS